MLCSGREHSPPSTDVGLRHDAGDAETGTGVEIGRGMRYEGDRWSMEGSARTLLVHEAGGCEEWGASGSIRIDPGASGRGLWLSRSQRWRDEQALNHSGRDAGASRPHPSGDRP